MTDPQNIKVVKSGSSITQPLPKTKESVYPKQLRYKHLCNWLLKEDSREAFKAIVSFLGLGATVAAAIGIFITYQGSLEDRKITQQRLMTERFSKATELLASREKVTRIGAIFALERIAKDSPQDHGAIMELLSSYVEDRSPWLGLEKIDRKIDIDVQKSLTVIGRRMTQQDPKHEMIYLMNINLTGADFIRGNFNNTFFFGSNLSDSGLGFAKLSGANFQGANLHGASFYEADLTEADFSAPAHVKIKTNLSNTDFSRANLASTKFGNADLSGADLRETKNLIKTQLIFAKLCKTKLPATIDLKPDRDCPKTTSSINQL